MEASSDRSLTGCEGCTGQWCSRHGMAKGKTHKRLCATDQRYFDRFEHGKRPAIEQPSGASGSIERIKRQREHWLKLHTTLMDSSMFAEWVDAIPGCSTCRRDFRKLLESNLPRFDDWQRWTWEAHNAVNAKLGKPEIEWNEACNLWNWNPQKE